MTRTTSSTQEHAIVAIYETHTTAEAAVRALQGAGVDMKRLSIIGRDFQSEENVRGYYTTEDKIMVWAGAELSGEGSGECSSGAGSSSFPRSGRSS